ncbi:Hsp20/alpha crystallin family protein [Pontibacter sp. G13]|uniref:Hsp20/alpha crystallin family protein n=1 Tax=Pontibacter sp. G13 TaxID=3074898 RepID=UPI00288AFEF3|nr:Hsp20/alpha crystallin family protein [Pontibacter sp. G13]WNJ18006.1 Hsp20/alpha crystallin family protein [Pontibacter sp. G13]
MMTTRTSVHPAHPFRAFFGPRWAQEVTQQTPTSFRPAVNVKETDTAFEIELVAPGFTKEDFKLELEQEVLTLRAELQEDQTETEVTYTRREFTLKSFKRTFHLPESVNTEEIVAKYEQGILNVVLPKQPEAIPAPARLIDIA